MDDLELMSHEELEATLHQQLLEQQLRYVAQSSAFYERKLTCAGLDPGKCGRPEHFANWPFTTKAEVIADQVANPPFGRLVGESNCGVVQRIHMTSGSSGQPMYVVLSQKDAEATTLAGRRAFRCAGVSPQDRIVHCLNYCMWAGGVTDHLSLEATGAAVIPFGVGNTSRLIETIRGLRPTAISCTPSYAARLELVLREEFSLAPRDLRLQKALFGGEGGLQDPSVRARIEDVWGMQAIDANYGMAEVLSIFGAECPERRGLHFHGQGLLYPELIDPDSLKPLPMAAGRVGELVVTNLIREAQPLIRYRTGDVITILGTEACPCGRRSLRFRVEGRSDDMIVVRGVNVYPSAVSRLLSQRPEWFTGEFEFVLNAPPPIDRPLLRVEVRVDVDSVNRGAIESFLVNACRRQLQFTPITSLIPLGALPRTEGKTKRIRRDY